MIDVFHRQVQLVFMVLAVLAVLRASVGKYPQQADPVILEEEKDPVVEYAGGHQGVLTVIQLHETDFAVGIDERLLVDAPHPFDIADIESVLGP